MNIQKLSITILLVIVVAVLIFFLSYKNLPNGAGSELPQEEINNLE